VIYMIFYPCLVCFACFNNDTIPEQAACPDTKKLNSCTQELTFFAYIAFNVALVVVCRYGCSYALSDPLPTLGASAGICIALAGCWARGVGAPTDAQREPLLDDSGAPMLQPSSARILRLTALLAAGVAIFSMSGFGLQHVA